MHALRETLLGHGNGYLIKDGYEREVKQLEVKKNPMCVRRAALRTPGARGGQLE